MKEERSGSAMLSDELARRGLQTRYAVLDARLGNEAMLDGETILARHAAAIRDPRKTLVCFRGSVIVGSDAQLLRELPPWVELRTFGPRAEEEFDALTMHAEPLYGDAYESPDALALYAALGLPPSSEEERLYRAPDGALLLIGGSREGNVYAIGGPSYTFHDGETEEDGGRHLAEEAALEALEAWVRGGDYVSDDGSTVYVHARAERYDGLVLERAVRVDPPPPPCRRGRRHEFVAPVEIVGGNEDNPGVFAHGGGVREVEVCLACGCKRVLDTWGTDRATGEEGVPVLSYEPAAYADEARVYREARYWTRYADPDDSRVEYRCDPERRFWQRLDMGDNPPTWRYVSENDVPYGVFAARMNGAELE